MYKKVDRHSLPLAGYPIQSITSVDLSRRLNDRLGASQKSVLTFANTNFVNKCQGIRPWLSGEDVFVVNDGVGMDIAAFLTHGKRFEENLNGTDFVPFFLKNLDRRHKVFLLGGKEGVAEKAATFIRQELGQDVVGCRDGYTPIAPEMLCTEINDSKAEIVLVAMGNPIQEEWIRAHMAALDARLFISVGALFDFLSGGTVRAPVWIQKARCEWLFRLALEPRRLVRRYTVDIVQFLFLCLGYSSRSTGKTNTENATQ